MPLQTPLPYAFAQREEFLKLPLEKRTSHLWNAHKFCKEQIGKKRFSDSELERNIGVLQRMLLQVAKHIAAAMRDEGAWRDTSDARWPRNHKGADPEHWYDSGAFPPQFLTLPTDPTSWREILKETPDALFDEMIAWAETPAGQAGVNDEELQKLLADRDCYVPEAGRTDALHQPEADRDSTVQGDDRTRSAALGWLSDKSMDGSLSSWASKLKLEGVNKFLGGVSSNRRSIERLLPELMKLEKDGEFEQLQGYLVSSSPEDAESLRRLRACLPKSRL